jgi:GTP-binding protein
MSRGSIACVQEQESVALPRVAIVGRPNVGKSSLFNWLAGRRIAIVDPTPGVTRDRLAAPVQVAERYLELIDTGGMGIEDVDNLTRDVERQIDFALRQADVVLFVVDARSGPVPLDEEVAARLRGLDKPVLLVANKCDYARLDTLLGEFHKLGFGEPLRVSAQQGRGRQELLAAILKRLPADTAAEAPPEEEPFKLAIVGRRNTGKSTFINALAHEERPIVSEIEGTTRDSIDVRIERDGKSIIAIDTAGVRYRGKVKTDIEFYSMARAERSIRRADVVLHFLDAAKKVSLVDKQLAGYILENYKPAIFVANKWDLLKDQLATGEFADYLHRVFPSLDFVPTAFVTAKQGRNVAPLLNLARNLFKQSATRVGTGDLNRVLQAALAAQTPPLRQNRQPKLYYATQVAIQPPTVVLFTNGPELFDNTYRRYLLKSLRDALPFKDVPIKLYLRAKQRDDEEEKVRARPQARAIPRGRSKKKQKDVGELWDDV